MRVVHACPQAPPPAGTPTAAIVIVIIVLICFWPAMLLRCCPGKDEKGNYARVNLCQVIFCNRFAPSKEFLKRNAKKREIDSKEANKVYAEHGLGQGADMVQAIGNRIESIGT